MFNIYCPAMEYVGDSLRPELFRSCGRDPGPVDVWITPPRVNLGDDCESYTLETWRMYNEFQNLRILLRNQAYGKPAPATREEVFLVEGFSN